MQLFMIQPIMDILRWYPIILYLIFSSSMISSPDFILYLLVNPSP